MKDFVKFKKCNKLIQQHISNIIIKDFSNNNIITVTAVCVKDNLLCANVFISSFDNTQNIIKLLNSSAKKIRHILSCKIKSFKIPNLVFLDDSKNTFYK